MKKVTIRVVKSRPDNILVKDFEAAKKRGNLEVNAVTAIENVRASKGLYEIVPEKATEDVTLNMNGTPIEEMTRAQLFTAAVALGVTIKNKKVETSKLRDLISKQFQEFVDGAPDETDEE